MVSAVNVCRRTGICQESPTWTDTAELLGYHGDDRDDNCARGVVVVSERVVGRVFRVGENIRPFRMAGSCVANSWRSDSDSVVVSDPAVRTVPKSKGNHPARYALPIQSTADIPSS